MKDKCVMSTRISLAALVEFSFILYPVMHINSCTQSCWVCGFPQCKCMCFLQDTDADFFVVQYECSGLFMHMHESKDLAVKAGIPASVQMYTHNREAGRCAHAGDDESPIIHTIRQWESEQERLHDNMSGFLMSF